MWRFLTKLCDDCAAHLLCQGRTEHLRRLRHRGGSGQSAGFSREAAGCGGKPGRPRSALDDALFALFGPDFLDNNSYRPEFVAHYEAEFYRYDPYYRYWKETERPGVVPLTRVTNGKATRSRYVNVVLTEAGISDAISVFLPPVGGSSLALFLDRFEGYFAKPDIARLEMAYPLIAGLHKAHVSCLMSGACDPADGANAALPEGRPIRILDRRGRE